MKNSLPLWAALAALLLAGCGTMSRQGSGVAQGAMVTRFHLGQPVARAEIRIEPADPARAAAPEFAATVAAVERELTRLGWTVTQGNLRSEQVARVTLGQATRPSGRRRGGDIVTTELSVRIQRRSDATVAWEGRAQLEAQAGSPLAAPAAAVDRLATALFQDFPGESGRTITVR